MGAAEKVLPLKRIGPALLAGYARLLPARGGVFSPLV